MHDQWASLSADAQLGHLLIHMQLEIRAPGYLQEGILFFFGIGPFQPIHFIDPQINIIRQFFPQGLQESYIFRYAYSSRTQSDACLGQCGAFFGESLCRGHLWMESSPETQLFPVPPALAKV